MKNRDMPVAPCSVEVANLNSDGAVASYSSEDQYGLTKREHFAGLAMAAMVSNSNLKGGEGMSADAICEFSVKFSDSLLEALEQK